MSSSIQALSQAMRADQKAMVVISQNVMNLSTPGFKRVLADSSAPLTTAEPMRETVLVDASAGSLKQTESALHFAIKGEGFFVLQKRDGTQVLSRDGDFRIGQEGFLINAMGDLVLGEAGPIALSDDQIQVDAEGLIKRGDVSIDQIQIRSPELLTPTSAQAHQFVANNLNKPSNFSVAQAALEGSNVSSADEMVRLITISRHMETMQRALNVYDRTLDTGINRLGDN